ncbi:MAG: mannose-1-phosphate guanylyltransferase, partial [Spirochaetes bacterium]
VPADTAEELYKKLPSISVDYAVMEKSLSSAMVKASFQWSDVGSWDEVARVAHTEKKDVFSHEAEGNFVFSDMPVALVGVDDLLVIQKKDALLICKKGESQKIRDIVDKIRKKRRGSLL